MSMSIGNITITVVTVKPFFIRNHSKLKTGKTVTTAKSAISSRLRRAAVLSTSRLCKDYPMGEITVHALKNVDFELREGEMTVLLGASGSGKSTLINETLYPILNAHFFKNMDTN